MTIHFADCEVTACGGGIVGYTTSTEGYDADMENVNHTCDPELVTCTFCKKAAKFLDALKKAQELNDK